MKKHIIKINLVFIFIISLSFNGCILDAFDTLVQNIPITTDFELSGSQTSLSHSSSFSLDNSTTYQEYRDKIKKITFLKIAYRTISVVPSTLSGNITVSLKDGSGTALFTKSITNAKPVDYISTPYELTLTQAEISLIDTYLSLTSNRNFTGTISVDNIGGGNPPYELHGVIDIVFQMEAKP